MAGLLGTGVARGFKGGENNATRTVRTDQGSIGEGGQVPPSSENGGSQNLEQPPSTEHKPVEQGEAGKASASGRVNPYRLEQEEGGQWAITAPDGSIVSTHNSLQDARVAMYDANKPQALQKTSPKVPPPQQVKYIGEQEGFKGSPSIKLFNLTQPIVDAAGKEVHSAGSTVSEGTLKKYGIPVPEAPKPAPPVAKLSPEAQGHLDDVSKELGAKVDLVSEAESGNPFASRLKGNIATIDRNTGKVLVNPEQFESWLKDVPHNQRRLAVKSVIAEEQNHLATDDSAAKAYWSTLSGPEKKIIQNRYGQAPNMNDTLWGHEAVNFELQRLARMTPHQVLAAARGEKWKLKSLAVLETTIRGIRKVLGTKASQEGLAILDQVQQNLRLGRIALSARGKADAAAKALAARDADKLDSLADMHIQSGDPETGEAMKKTAKRIRGEGQTPAAKPRNQERPSEGEFWMNPDGDLERAEDGHQNFAHDKRVADGEKPSENETPFKDYEYLRSRGWTRVFVSRYGGMGRIYFSGDISNSQLSELRNVAIEHEMELVRETPSGKGAILWSPLDDAPAARPRKRNESVFQDKFFLPGEATQNVYLDATATNRPSLFYRVRVE